MDHQAITAAIEASFTGDTSVHDDWTAANPARGHCDVASFVAWEHLGGDLVLGEVHVDGVFQEHHYWNRIGDVDVDFTQSQFAGHEVITEKAVHDSALLAEKRGTMQPELLARIGAFRAAVATELAASSTGSS